MIDILKNIIGKKISRLFLIVWPPFGERDTTQIDISVGFVIEGLPNRLLKISTDKNDLTIPTVEYQATPEKYFSWEDFDSRMKGWIQQDEELEIDTEYYEVSDVNIFQDIVSHKILDVELISIENQAPLGIKLIFAHDFILSTPLSDGNTIETSFFNKNDNLKIFKTLGKIEYFSLKT